MLEAKRYFRSRLEDLLNPELSQREIDRRKDAAIRIARMFMQPEWQREIKSVYIYGSIVYGNPRKNSDVDIALVTYPNSIWNHDLAGSWLLMTGLFHEYREKLGFPYLKADCAVIPQDMFENPENVEDKRNRQLYIDVMTRGIEIF